MGEARNKAISTTGPKNAICLYIRRDLPQMGKGAALAPELNPMENIWQFMRDNWLSNQIFQTHDDIVNHCCKAWRKLIADPWKIISIGLRDWAHRF